MAGFLGIIFLTYGIYFLKLRLAGNTFYWDDEGG